jgi:hypothetical protein
LPKISDLEQQRAQLYRALAESGDSHRGSIGATYRRCGKPNCTCTDLERPGHGHRHRHRLTRSLGSKTRAKQLHARPELEKATREAANYRHSVALSLRIIEVKGQICGARPISAPAEEELPRRPCHRAASGPA